MAILSGPKGMLLGAMLAVGCDDSLVDQSYRGTVLFTLRGNVTGSSDSVDSSATVRIAMFWSPSGPDTHGTDGLVEQPSASQQAELPFSFTLNLFDAAPPDMFYTRPGNSPYAIAQLLGYPDRNQNHQRDADEPIVAATAGRAVLYAATAIAAAQSPTGQPIPAGYHLIFSSVPCGPPVMALPAAPAGARCTVPLGEPCSVDTQCAPGVCIRDFLTPWPQGACGMADPLPPGCGPPAATRVTTPGPDKTGPAYWLKSCTIDADCGRDLPYQCDLALGACAPTRSLLMQVGDPPMVAPWCR